MSQPSATLQQTTSLSSSLTSSPYAPTHHDHALLNVNSNGTLSPLEPSLYTLQPDLSSLSNANTDPQKITLLSRMHPTSATSSQVPISSSPLGSRLDDSVLSRMTSSVHTSSLLSSADTSPLSRQREYYFDTEDPSVNLHDFIINSLQAPKYFKCFIHLTCRATIRNRVILLQLEDEFVKYISDPTRTESLKLPSWDSYHRMLAHRVAAYFGLEHNVDPQDKTRVVVLKGPSTRLPQQRFSDHIPTAVYEEPDLNEPKSILKRIRGTSASEKFDGLASNPSEIKTFEEREEEYEKARARIFSQSSTHLHDTDSTDIPFDLFTSSPFARNSLRTPLHHRRTFSDTAFINKWFSHKENKQGPSSSGNSPSCTPAFLPPSPPDLSTPSSSAVGKINQTFGSPDDNKHLGSRQHQKRSLPSRPTPPTFMPFYTSTQPPAAPTAAAIPVLYHPQSVIDPNSWYYNHMLLYPVNHQGAGGYPVPQFVQSPVLPHYSLPSPHGVFPGPPASSRVSSIGIRVPSTIMAAEHVLGSPTNPTNMVYPSPPNVTPHRPAGSQMKSEDYAAAGSPLWSPQGIPLPTMYSAHQQSSTPPQYNIVATQLVEQMEKNLTLSETVGGGDTNPEPDSTSVPPIGGQRQPMYMATGRSYGQGQLNMYGYPNVHVDPMVVSPPALVQPTQFFHGPIEHMQGSVPPPPHPPNSFSFSSNMPMHGRDQPHPGTPTLPPGVIQPTMQSPVQILGHTLSTSIFSPPPSSAGPPGMFMGHAGRTSSPPHSAIGSGTRFQRFDSPKQTRVDVSLQNQMIETSPSNGGVLGGQPLPPRLSQRGGAGGGGTRYQNQRHPSNRSMVKSDQQDQPSSLQQHVQYSQPSVSRKEPLLPTPSEMIKLDTGITAGVPVHIMEVLNPPSEDSSDNSQLISTLKEHGANEFKRGWMNRNTEIMVAVFENSDVALQALKMCVLPLPAKLSIPLPTHAKHILQLL